MASCTKEVALQGLRRLVREEGIIGLRLSWKGCEGGVTGALIVVEGIDGAGISTHSEALSYALRELVRNTGEDVAVFYTKEPTFGPIGFLLYQVLKGGPFSGLKDPLHMALLFAADRYYHLMHEELDGCQGIIACLKGQPKPGIVVSDRYKYSSIAYQSVEPPKARGAGGSPSQSWLWLINAFAPPPHILVYLDVDPDTAMDRIRGERWGAQLYEQREFLARVREAFNRIMDLLARTGEVEVGNGKSRETIWSELGYPESLVPSWRGYLSPCHYPAPGGERIRYPAVVTVNTAQKGIEDSFYDVLVNTIRLLESRGIVEAVRSA